MGISGRRWELLLAFGYVLGQVLGLPCHLAFEEHHEGSSLTLSCATDEARDGQQTPEREPSPHEPHPVADHLSCARQPGSAAVSAKPAAKAALAPEPSIGLPCGTALAVRGTEEGIDPPALLGVHNRQRAPPLAA